MGILREEWLHKLFSVLGVALIAITLYYPDCNVDSTSIRLLSFSDRPPITINGESDLTVSNGVSKGNGTEHNPYVIEGYEIDAAGNEAAIHVKNTSSFLVIRNCSLQNGNSNIIVENAQM